MVREKSSRRLELVREEIAERVLLHATLSFLDHNKETRLERWARRWGLNKRRAKGLAYKEYKVLPAHEVDDIREITGCLKALRERKARLEAETSFRAPDQLALPLVGGAAHGHGRVD